MGTIQKNNRSLGFTLMEIVIAMVIIAILSASVLGNFFSSFAKGRDSRRKQDLELYAKALELYYNDHRAYPTGHENIAIPGTPLTDGTTTYMQKIPPDPKSSSGWIYDYDPLGVSGSGYALYACLENKNDPKRTVGGYAGSDGVCVYCTTEGNGRCNYAISSSNVTPP